MWSVAMLIPWIQAQYGLEPTCGVLLLIHWIQAQYGLEPTCGVLLC